MDAKDFTYISLESNKAVFLRKNLLKLEMDLLKIMQKILAYKILRKDEARKRVTLRRKLEETSVEMKNLLLNIPKIETPATKQIESEIKIVKEEKRKLSC